VDGAFIGGLFFAVVWAATDLGSQLPAKALEVASAATLITIGILYEGLFLTLAGLTPGMRYAGLALSTFNREKPGRQQMRRRVGAVLLSLLPVGLGVLWAIFDEDHLSWHDRISKTYQRLG